MKLYCYEPFWEGGDETDAPTTRWFRSKADALKDARRAAKEETPRGEGLEVQEVELSKLAAKDLLVAALNARGFVSGRKVIQVVKGRMKDEDEGPPSEICWPKKTPNAATKQDPSHRRMCVKCEVDRKIHEFPSRRLNTSDGGKVWGCLACIKEQISLSEGALVRREQEEGDDGDYQW